MPLYSDVNNRIAKTKLTTTEPARNLGIVFDLATINQSIDNIISTRKGERVMLPEFGADFDGMLFELMDDVTGNTLLSTIFSAVEVWEPRITVDYSQSRVVPDIENHLYYVRLIFQVKGLDATKYEYNGVVRRPE